MTQQRQPPQSHALPTPPSPTGVNPSVANELAPRLLDAVAVGIVEVAADGNVRYANTFARQLLALMAEGIRGQSLHDFEPHAVSPDGERLAYDDYPAIKCLRTGEVQGPTTMGLRVADGSVRWVTTTTIPIMAPGTGQVESAVATFIDTSHSRQIEAAYVQSEERYRRLIDDAPDAIVVHHRGQVLLVNDAAVRLWGARTKDEILGQHIMRFVHPDFYETIRNRVERAAEGETVPLFDHLNVRLDGSVVAVESTAMPCVFNGQKCVQAILRDVTQRKADQEALRRANDELELRVAQRTQELSDKNEQLQTEIADRRRAESQLQERQRLLKKLLAVHERERQLVAYEMHDTFLQDVIGALMFVDGFYELREQAGASGLEPVDKARRLLRKAIDEARRMISGLRPPIIDEQGVVAAIEYLTNEAKRRGLDVRFERRGEIQRLPNTVEATLFRIVQESLKNWERHSRAASAVVRLTQTPADLRLEVEDQGVGFDPETVEEGHFGLEGMRERARLIGADFRIESTLGKGTKIVLRLPLNQELTAPFPAIR